MPRTGLAHLPLHGGSAPRWLFDRMVLLSRQITLVIVEEFGPGEMLARLSPPHWFPALGPPPGPPPPGGGPPPPAPPPPAPPPPPPLPLALRRPRRLRRGAPQRHHLRTPAPGRGPVWARPWSAPRPCPQHGRRRGRPMPRPLRPPLPPAAREDGRRD